MDDILKKTSDIDQCISNATETSGEEKSNNFTDPKLPIIKDFSEKVFDTVIVNIKTENDDEFFNNNDSEDSAFLNVAESNSEGLTDTALVDGTIVSKHTSSPSTALPITQILSRKSTPHTCQKCCFWCSKVFRVLDSPYHIGRIRSIDKQNEFFNIEPGLKFDSCLCDFCWKYLEKSYRSIMAKKKKGDSSFAEKRSRLLERVVRKNLPKNKSQARRCSIHCCSRVYHHKMSVKECENIKNLISTFEYFRYVFVQSQKTTPDYLNFPFCLCEDHFSEINVISSCQICGESLHEHFNADDWSMYDTWNFVLFDNNLSLVLQPGMFICLTCKGHISPINPIFPTIDLPRFREYIMLSNTIRLRIYGEPEYNYFNIYKGSTYVAFPIVVPKIKEEKDEEQQKIVHSTKVRFSVPLITATYHYESDYDENYIKSITSTALLNVAEQDHCIPKLEPKDEELEEEYFKIFTANEPEDQLYSFYTDPILGTDNVEMIHLLNKSDNDNSENISEQNSTDNNVSKNVFNYFTDTAKNHVTTNVNGNNDLLHVDHQLKNYKNKIFINEKINQYPGIDNVYLLQNHCQVNNVNIDKNRSEIIDTHQVITGHNEIENNQSKLKIVSVYSQAVGSVAQDRSSMDLMEAVEPHNAVVNPVSLKRKRSNVVCHRIPNKSVKKQRLNEKSSSYEYNSTGNNTVKSYKNQKNAHSIINSPSILNMISNFKNEYVLNSDFIDVQDMSSDVDGESLMLHSNSMKNIELNTNVPSIHIENAYSLNSSYMSPLNIKQTSKKNPNFNKKKKLSRNGVKKNLLVKDISDSESLSDSIILSDSDSLSDFEIVISDTSVLLDSETFSETESEETLSDSEVKETDYIVILSRDDLNSNSDSDIVDYEFETKTDCTFISDSKKLPDDKMISNAKNILECTTLLDSAKDLNCETTTDVKESECIIVSNVETESDNEEEFDNRKLCSFNIVTDVQKGSNCEILDGKKREFVSESGNERVECIIVSDDEIEPSADNESQCIIISDNEDEFDNRKLRPFNIITDDQKGSNCEILDGKKREFVSESGNGRVECIIVSDEEIEPSGDNGSQCIIISDNEDEFDNRKLRPFNIITDVQKGSNCEILDGKKREFMSESGNGRVECIIVSDEEIEPFGDNGSQCIIISDNEDEFVNRKLRPFNIVTDVQKGSNCEILDGKKREFVSESGNGRVECIIVSDEEIEPSGDNGSQCIIISDNEDEFDNRKLRSFNIVTDIQKGSNCEILDGEKREFVPENENGRVEYIIVSDEEIELSGDNGSQYIIISDNEDEFDNRKLRPFNIVTDVQKGSNCEILDAEKLEFVPESENERVEYIIVSEEEIELSGDHGSQYIIVSDNEEEFNNKKVPDIKIISNDKIIVDDSQALKMLCDNNTINKSKINSDKKTSQLNIKSKSFKFPCLGLIVCEDGDNDAVHNEIQKYFKEIFSYIRYYINNSEDQSLKNLYSMIGNDADMLLYLMENFRMLYNGELVVSETASKFSEDYYNEQITILYDHYGHPKDNINASKPFILRSSHLHQYSKRLSNIEPVIIKDITTTTGSSTHRGSISSPKVTVTTNKPISKVSNKLTTIRPPKSFPLYDSKSKSRCNIISTKSKSIVQKKLPTYTKPLLTSAISHSPNDTQTLTSSVLHPAKVKIQLPAAIRPKTIRKPKVYHHSPVEQPPTIQLPTAVRSSTMLTKPPVLARSSYPIRHSANNVNCNDPIRYVLLKNQYNK